MYVHWMTALFLVVVGCFSQEDKESNSRDTAPGDTPETAGDSAETAGDSQDSTSHETDSFETADTSEPGETGDTGDGGPLPVLEIDPSDSRLLYVGRWDFENPSRPMPGWRGASFSFVFDGTDLQALLDAGSEAEIVRVLVDGASTTRIDVGPGVASYALATGLERGEHRVDVVVETREGPGFTLQGLTVTGYPQDAPAPASRHLEFYGDSTLAGVSLMDEHGVDDPALAGAYFTYAGIVARAFGADHHNLSLPEASLDSMVDQMGRLDVDDSTGSWDFARYEPDAVVVDLGAVDLTEVPLDELAPRFTTLLDGIREVHPDTPIVLFNGYGRSYTEVSDITDAVVDDYGDPNVSVAFYPWFFDSPYACESDQGGMAHALIDHLEDILGWEAEEPDVLNGLGLEDVANGSFEETAPFGGYAWRYMDDPDVERVYDPDEAPDGDYYLRVGEEGSARQVIAGESGESIQLGMWLRTFDEVAVAYVVVSFANVTEDDETFGTSMTSIVLREDDGPGWYWHEVTARAAYTGTDVEQIRISLSSSIGSYGVDGLVVE